MADRRELSYGATGEDVVQLQNALNGQGYQLDTDGIFGEKTRAAVKDYQSRNNLASDGIVGSNTWGSLDVVKPTISTTATSQTKTEQSQPSATQGQSNAPAYVESDVVKQAEAMLQQQMAAKPGEYTSQWQGQLDDVINRILNREDFSYDVNADALYQQYKDQYTRQGKLAMMDTMGQAAALTGGYGNSYAQNVGQQAYQGYLQQLNDRIPELYQLALDKYRADGDDLYDRYSLLGAQEDRDYGRYRDQLGDWQTERDYLQNRYDTEREFDYGKYADALGYQQWQAEFDEDKRRYEAELAAEQASSGGSSSGGGGGGTGDDTERSAADPEYSGYQDRMAAATTLADLRRIRDEMLNAGFGDAAFELYAMYEDKFDKNGWQSADDGNRSGSARKGSNNKVNMLM